MTTDPPTEFEEVRIENWQSRLPSEICMNKEFFDEVFSLETWKTVLTSAQRDRIMKMLPPEVLKVSGAAEKTIEDLFCRKLVSFNSNPLDAFFDKLACGLFDPEVVETKTDIVRVWKRESRRMKKNYHTKLLQDIVVSREKHLKKIVSMSPEQKKNGKKSASNNVSNNSVKKNGKPWSSNSTPQSATTTTMNGSGALPGGNKGGSKSHVNKNASTEPSNGTSSNSSKANNLGQPNKKRGRVETKAQSLPTPGKDSGTPEEPVKKKSKQTAKSKAAAANKKAKDIVVVTTTQSSSLLTSSLLSGNSANSSLLLGTLTGGNSHLDPPTLSLRSFSSSTPPTSLLESLTSPIKPLPQPTILSGSGCETITSTALGKGKQYPKIFPGPILSPSSATSTQLPSFLPSPVQSSPILASQLQAPSISVNLSSITGSSLASSRNTSVTSSPSLSSITLNYTQTPPPAATVTLQQQPNETLLDEESSSDEFEFEAIEPTIGFGGPSTTKINANLPNLKTTSTGIGAASQSGFKKGQTGTISSQELANIQKCSLLTNCLTQPLPPNSSAAAVSAALANNILTSTPVPAPVVTQGGVPAVYQILHQQPQAQEKIIVTTSGVVANPSATSHQQLQKFLSISPSLSPNQTQKVIAQHQQLGLFQSQPKISTQTPTHTAVDAQALVNSIMASSKDLLATFGASITDSGSTAVSATMNQLQQHSASVLPISLNLQNVSPTAVSVQQQSQLKQAALIRAQQMGNSSSGLLHTAVSPQTVTNPSQQILNLPSHPQSIVIGQSSSLNTQSLQLPSSILSSGAGNVGKISAPMASSIPSSSISSLLDSDDLNLNLSSFSLGGLGGMNLDMEVNLPDIDTSCIGSTVGSVDNIKLEIDCGMDKIDDLSGVLDGNPFDSIPNLSDELDGLDLDMVDGLCDFEGLLSEEKQYASFFSLIRDVLCSTRDHRMTLVCLEKTIRKWALGAAAALNPWFMRVHDWNSALIVALNFLAGNYQDVHPEDFVPYIEYKYKTKYYQWIGAGRDGDNNLSPLCNLWLENLERLPPLKKNDADGDEPEEEEDDNEDSDTGAGGDSCDAKKKNKRPQTPPPPRCTTDWTVRPSTMDEKEEFRHQEKSRFDNPHKAFTYRMHNYESVVGPVKGVYSSQSGITNKARGHSLLVDDRPPYVTILALVRDAVARLPNGEGTRSEICEMLRDSAFLAPEASNVTLNSVVSGALDRLHYERDPCVRYDSHKKSWIYLHRDRTQEQFERLHHNRSYTKSTKSRNSSNRKGRKGNSKSSTTSTVPTSTSLSLSSSSSQSSISATETSLQSSVAGTSTNTTVATVLGVGSGAGGVVSTTQGGSVVTLPPLSTINPKIGGQLNTLPAPGDSKQQGKPQTIGLVSISSPSIQLQAQQQPSSIAAALQQSLSTVSSGQRILSLPAGGTHDGTQLLGQSSLSDLFTVTNSGLRLQGATGNPTSVVMNQLGQQQGTSQQQQATLIQDPTGGTTTARLVLQQQPGLQSQAGNSHQASTQQVQVSSQQLPAGAAGANMGPSQILLGSSAAGLLKLAGNIRLGDGLRLTQLRLPTGGTAGNVGTSASTVASSQLRLPQHRILLARGALPGQAQAQGVLLGQTATGQTVILSAGPAPGGSLAGLQQALSSSSATAGQIAVHASQLEPLASTGQVVQNQQQQQSGGIAQSLQGFASSSPGAASAAKFGIITSNVSPNGSSVMVSSVASQSSTAQGKFSAAASRMQVTPVGNSSSTLPSTSIALPASLLAPTSSSGLSSNITVGTPGTHLSQQQQTSVQQQLILSSSGVQQQQSQAQSSQQIGSIQGALGVPGSVQLQGITQAVQQQQNLLIQQPSSSHQQQVQGQALQSQMHQQLAAPIIIRSAQGDFVSFGIPSHLSLGRGVQGIKVIPFQAGKQTVLARIVPPSVNAASTIGGSGSSVGTVVTMGNGINSMACNSGNVNGSLSQGGGVTLTNVPLGSSGSVPLQSVNAAGVAGSGQPAINTCSTNSNANNITNGNGGGGDILAGAVMGPSNPPPAVANNQSSNNSSSS